MPRPLRTALVSAAPAAVIGWTWLRLEQPARGLPQAAALLALGIAAAAVRPLAARVGAVVVAAGLGAWLAFGLSPLHPRHFFGPLGSRFGNGFLDFYDVRLPFDPRLHPDMRSVVLVALFAFALLVALLVAAGRPLPAVLALLAGAGWPATLVGPANALLVGTVLLVAALTVLAGLSRRRLPRATVAVVVALAALALGAASSGSVSKRGVVAWQHWRPVARSAAPVGVSFVWDARYRPIRFPPKRTTVLEIAAPRTPSLYWRAAFLDDFVDDAWDIGAARPGDALEPPAALRAANQTKQTVTIEALTGTRLVGGGVPMRFAADVHLDQPVPGTALLGSGLSRGFRYSVWSYAPQPSAAQLRRSPARYPAQLRDEGLLDVYPGVAMPSFGTPARAARARAAGARHPELAPYAPLARLAEQVAGAARTPYDAAAALDRWFRATGGFVYTNTPARSAFPLADFVAHTRAGYCQHFAGAMALMLRYLGVPARVAVGFSSGTYSASKQAWIVTDHDAHAWVEAWFAGYGWLPFDPTPSAQRPELGTLSAAYATPQGGGPAPRTSGGSGSAQSSHHHGDEFGAGFGNEGATARAHGGRSLLGTLVLLVLLLAATTLAGIVLTKLALTAVRRLRRDPRRVASACREELAAFLLDQQIVAARSATLHELGALLRRELAVDPDRFVAAASAARFGPQERAAATAHEARRELRRLLRDVRHRLSGRERLRGLLSLRSLGVDASA